jgi:hypothetical protein
MTVAGSSVPPRQRHDPGQLTAQRDSDGPMVPASAPGPIAALNETLSEVMDLRPTSPTRSRTAKTSTRSGSAS